MHIAIIGATGMVGRKVLEVLAQRKFRIDKLSLAASERSQGKCLDWQGKEYTLQSIQEVLEEEPHIAFFAAGGNVSRAWAPAFARKGCYVIDKSSAWRMDNTVPLVIPEINAHTISPKTRIIASPNCSTSQLVMVLYPLHEKWGLNEVIVSTYQSVSGTGKAAVKQLESEKQGLDSDPVYPHPIFNNCIAQCDEFAENGYTKEELKLMNETKKILNLSTLSLSATAVRVPVTIGHSESVTLELEAECKSGEVRDVLTQMPGVVVIDDPQNQDYPTPLLCQGSDAVYVGRIRQDLDNPKRIHLWIVSDNLRKGAATNAIQIAEFLVNSGFLDQNA